MAESKGGASNIAKLVSKQAGRAKEKVIWQAVNQFLIKNVKVVHQIVAKMCYDDQLVRTVILAIKMVFTDLQFYAAVHLITEHVFYT